MARRNARSIEDRRDFPGSRVVKKFLKRSMIGLLVLAVVCALAVFIIFESGLAEKWLRSAFISRIEQSTGTRVEMGGFHLHAWHLRLEIDDLTVHGLEAAGQPPLFHADRVDVAIRIISFFSRKIALDQLIVQRPDVAVQIDKGGHSNLPAPKGRPSNRPWRQTLFSLQIGQLALREGSVLYKDHRTPLDVNGQNFNFVLHYDKPAAGADSYVGTLSWQQVRLAAKKDVPFRFDFSTKFRLHRDSFEADELIVKALHSELDMSAQL